MKGVNEYGVVEDLDLAKRIIKEKFSGWPFTFVEDRYPCMGKEKTVKEWLKRVDEDLEEFDGNYSIMRDGGYSLGGPDGWSGFFIQEVNAYFNDMNFKDWGDFNPNEETMCTILDEEEQKFITFILHETD